MDVSSLHRALKRAGVRVGAGLTNSEFTRIEQTFSFEFPPDLRAVLSEAMPIGVGWPNWRTKNRASLRERLHAPYEGICFDIEHNRFWRQEWGQRPVELQACFAIARQALVAAPTLIPIVGHRYIPDRPRRAGNPVFSVHQTDIIYYGSDLADFFANEFQGAFGRLSYIVEQEPNAIEFWSDFV